MHASLKQTPHAWVTLITSPSYLPGAIILGYSLKKHASRYPLVVLVTRGVGDVGLRQLRREQQDNDKLLVHEVDPLLTKNTGGVAERFRDTFTKLRAFQLHEIGLEKGVFLDADMAVFRNPDALFEEEPPSADWILANHACVCNLDKSDWAAPDWKKENCAYTPIVGSDAEATRVHPSSRRTYHLLNSGMFVYRPTPRIWSRMLKALQTSEKVESYQFPDQDFLADFFWNKWQSLSWKYNAIKTMRYWHSAMWSDSAVVIVHYIVDKPWQTRIASDGVAGHLGRDGVTHQWWWNLYEEWLQKRWGKQQQTKFITDKVPDHKNPSNRDESILAGLAKPLNLWTNLVQVLTNLWKYGIERHVADCVSPRGWHGL